MPQLKDKVALITGAGRGIGQSIALAFAKEGAKLVISDLQKDFLTETEAKAKELGRAALKMLNTLVTPDTLLRWHRQLVATK